MSLYIESHGQGENLVLLHGWGMHGVVWQQLLPYLTPHFRVHIVDLPGHGFSPFSAHSLASCVQSIRALLPAAPLHLVGWSLGGLLAQQWCVLYPEQIMRLVLLASSPCFMQREDWQAAMSPAVLAHFAEALQESYAATLTQFVTLQTLGDANPRQLARDLQAQIAKRPAPHLDGLLQGLSWLEETDLRTNLADLRLPVALIYGDKDTLVPLACAEWLAERLDGAELHIVRGCGHAPHWSHTALCAEVILAGQICH